MKTQLLLCLAIAPLTQALEVHEWGTFTVLSSSSGNQVSWYQPYTDLAALPDFVGKSFGKSATARVRMETPVLYFYSEEEQDVSVEVNFKGGNITETFPFSPRIYEQGRQTASWTGRLLPPDHQEALALIPEVKNPDPTEPYAAAREVPDAWIFKSSLTENPFTKNEILAPQAEKFIFYRGSGSTAPNLLLSLSGENEISLTSREEMAFPFSVALQVSGENASWEVLPELAAKAEMSNTLETPSIPISQAEAELSKIWETALTEQGLTPEESAAMVATWKHTWFREQGTRVLTIVPQEWVDPVLPISITPAPKELKRVFVARLEVLSPAQEDRLLTILGGNEFDPEEAKEDLDSLNLGRFQVGGLTIATQKQAERMLVRFYDLRRVNSKPED